MHASKTAVDLPAEAVTRVSHELRTPLNAIMGFAELIRRNPGADPRETTQSAQQICRAGKHLLSLINDLQNIASVEANGLGASLRPMHVANLVQECVGLMTPYANQRRVSLTASVAPSLPAGIADPRALKQILFNLIGNAIKFSGPDSLVRIDAYLDPCAEWIVVSVEDDGPGIPSNAFERLFKPFSRVSGEGVKSEGTGLGLAISQHLAAAMGGAIDVTSCEGQGSVFSLRVPVSGEPIQHPDESRFEDMSVERQGIELAGNILYVEDEPINAMLMRHFCSSHPGIRLTIAESGVEAIRIARELQPDLVLLDINLPDMHGRDVLSTLRSNPMTMKTPIVALSADALMSHEHSPGQVGFDAHWLKPMDLGRLEIGLAKLLPSRGS
jgi:CheY-like chemotaxis protein